MALNKTVLHDAINAAFLANLAPSNKSQTQQVDDMADALATAIMAFVQSATITYIAGLATGPGGGAVTGVFTNTIS